MKIGFLGLLCIVFIVLKLTDVIDWHWALVLLPLYGGVIVTMLIGLCVAYITTEKKKR